MTTQCPHCGYEHGPDLRCHMESSTAPEPPYVSPGERSAIALERIAAALEKIAGPSGVVGVVNVKM